MPSSSADWTAAHAEDLYGFKRWGGRHFSVDATGCVCVHPAGDHRRIRLLDVIEEAAASGLRGPLTIRCQDLLRYRVQQLNEAFRAAIKGEDYAGQYKGVFPIKVNQLREVVEEILDAGEAFNFGLEAGSKPELLIALALHDNPKSLLICNGYKDEEYVKLALLGRKLGKEIFLVVEQISELRLIVELAREANIAPLIGFRVKLSTQGEGKWAESSGEDAKFGLTPPEMVEGARFLKQEGFADSLRLVHFHIGSQVPNILTLKKAVTEAARFYVELAKLGFPMQYLDVGGGLGIDYDGSRTNFESSMNYSLEEYCRDVVFNVKQVCEMGNIPVPNLISESGRALVAPHSILVVEVFDRISKAHLEPRVAPSAKPRHPILRALDELLENRPALGRLERYHDAQQKKEEAYNAFTLGVLDLEARAEAESLYWKVLADLRDTAASTPYVPEELARLPALLADQYVCNFSVFQSLIDHWACDQLFPVAPLHRLLEKPSVQATLVDITCDSEGKISEFIDLEDDVNRYLPVHPLDGKPYYLGVFLVGAYQDIMGDLHNLFGRVSEVHVFLEEDEEDGFYIEESIAPSKVNDVLRVIQHRGEDLARRLKRQVDAATREDRVKPREGVRWLDFYEGLLSSDTYLKPSPTRVQSRPTEKPTAPVAKTAAKTLPKRRAARPVVKRGVTTKSKSKSKTAPKTSTKKATRPRTRGGKGAV